MSAATSAAITIHAGPPTGTSRPSAGAGDHSFSNHSPYHAASAPLSTTSPASRLRVADASPQFMLPT